LPASVANPISDLKATSEMALKNQAAGETPAKPNSDTIKVQSAELPFKGAPPF
jgi:hypothetical protein